MRSLSRIVQRREHALWQEAPFPDLSCTASETTEVRVKTEEELLREKSQELFHENVEKAKAVLNQARIEALRIKKEAYEEGYVEGMEKGCEDGRKKAYEEHREELKGEYQNLREKLEKYAVDMQHAKEKVTEDYLDDLKNISLAIGEKIIQTSLKSSGDVVKNMILAATEKLKRTAWAKIYISDDPEEKAASIRGDADLLRELSKISDNVKIIVMEDAAPGTCIVELPQEVMDISVSTQMENIKEILNNARV
ncbi:MAG TPA: hypothetical protein H9780_06960 [Candidatus Mediterraneibacter merdavium]|nr:hypothetical protein [Candidatus Mediterraneibacter merdavium]